MTPHKPLVNEDTMPSAPGASGSTPPKTGKASPPPTTGATANAAVESIKKEPDDEVDLGEKKDEEKDEEKDDKKDEEKDEEKDEDGEMENEEDKQVVGKKRKRSAGTGARKKKKTNVMAHIASLMKGEKAEGPVPTATEAAYVLHAATAASINSLGMGLRDVAKAMRDRLDHLKANTADNNST